MPPQRVVARKMPAKSAYLICSGHKAGAKYFNNFNGQYLPEIAPETDRGFPMASQPPNLSAAATQAASQPMTVLYSLTP
jgi:hypothetical protein